MIPLSGQPFAVMIDNIVEARPHVGLAQADVIYEAPAEGGIPRLMPVYLRDEVDVGRVGPVRSTRNYFVYLAAEYGAAMVHVGSSPQGFQSLLASGLERVDESRGDAGFLPRDRRRAAPHDAFVTGASVRAQLAARSHNLAPSLGGLSFGTFPPGPEPATHLRLAYRCCVSFVAEYQYDEASGSYLRSMDGRPHADGDSGEQYAARSVIVQSVDVRPIPGDSAGRLQLGLVTDGTGILLAEGTRVDLSWTKTNAFEPTTYRRLDGEPFRLPEGPAWIELAPTDAQVEVS